MTERHTNVVLGFHNASDEQVAVIDALMKTGSFACVTFVNVEGVWLGWAVRQGDDDRFLYFAIDDGPPIIQAALDSLMAVLDAEIPEGHRAEVTTTVERVES